MVLLLTACGGGESSSGTPSSYVGTWHVLTQTLLGGGLYTPVDMDLSAQNVQLIITEENWIAKDNDPTSDCNSVTLSLNMAGSSWSSSILNKDGACPDYTGPNYTGTWSVSGNKLTWTMGTFVRYVAEKTD